MSVDPAVAAWTAALSCDHRVTIEFDRDVWSPRLQFECHAGPDAACRTVCPESECEEGCYHPEEHSRVPVDYCNNVEWFHNGDEVETCISGGRTSITLPVEVTWQDTRYDGPEWRFANGGAPDVR